MLEQSIACLTFSGLLLLFACAIDLHICVIDCSLFEKASVFKCNRFTQRCNRFLTENIWNFWLLEPVQIDLHQGCNRLLAVHFWKSVYFHIPLHTHLLNNGLYWILAIVYDRCTENHVVSKGYYEDINSQRFKWFYNLFQSIFFWNFQILNSSFLHFYSKSFLHIFTSCITENFEQSKSWVIVYHCYWKGRSSYW